MKMRINKQALCACALLAAAVSVRAAQSQNGVTFTINAAQDVHSISRYIYGINQPIPSGSNLTYDRLGGNRWTAYNWTNNYSNAGNDYRYSNDTFLGGRSTPGGAMIPRIENAAANHAGLLLTVPMNGYVSAAKSGFASPTTPPSDSPYFVPEYANAPASVTGMSTKPVYENQFVQWVKSHFPKDFTAGTTTPINFDLDNEPSLWPNTHPEVHPAPLTYAELLQKSITYSSMIKSIVPHSLVYGPVSYGWGAYRTLQNARDSAADNAAMDPYTGKPYGNFLSYYLAKMRLAGKAAGKRLLDVLDLHWYPEATGNGTRITTESSTDPAVVAARLQAPRSLWDSTYVEKSWIAQSLGGKAIDLLPRLQREINANYPGTKLSFSEYNYGGGSDISGGIAEADVLGIFGKYGVYSADEWPGASSEPFIRAAFAMYRNYNGHGATFGDKSISAGTSNVADTSVYASLDSKDPSHMIVIAINKTAHALTATIHLDHMKTFDKAEIYQLTHSSANPVFVGNRSITNPKFFTYTMPAYSVSTLNLIAVRNRSRN